MGGHLTRMGGAMGVHPRYAPLPFSRQGFSLPPPGLALAALGR
ncbi:hypothetical protein TCCBUS3UF1_9960 [Thermus sp. CCB_US3_UF1]|nr:hypothetical protein TCCBUS3UF1_9960 [Thermus sp. CCB_US3_UF1]